MRIDWVPVSAAAFVAGALALLMGAVLMPDTGDAGVRQMQAQVAANDGRWLAVAVLFFLASSGLLLGLPAVMLLFRDRATGLGLLACGVFAIGCMGTTGYAMLLAFFRSLAVHDALRPERLDAVTSDAGLSGFISAWIGAFYLGELLFAIALLRARSVPVWVPGLLLLHVALLPLGYLVPSFAGSWTVVLTAAAFAGMAISANGQDLPAGGYSGIALTERAR